MLKDAYIKKLTDRANDLKAELSTRYHSNWLNEYDSRTNNLKVELNLLLHDAIRKRILRQLALSKGIDFVDEEQTITNIFQVEIFMLNY